MYKIKYIKAFTDNYIWFIQKDIYIIAIDPGETQALIRYINEHKLILQAILLTHSHNDHIGGVKTLQELYNPQIIDNFANQLNNQQQLTICDLKFEVLITNGHTYDGVCYLLENTHLFCGDTLFSAGCGRVFTNDYQAMFDSLQKIKKLDINTLIYPAHEYTLINLNFAAHLEPSNSKIANYLLTTKTKRSQNEISLPTKLSDELNINPFLKTDNLKLKQQLITNYQLSPETTELEIFITLRLLRNNFIA